MGRLALAAIVLFFTALGIHAGPFVLAEGDRASAAAWSPDGSYLAVGLDGEVRLWQCGEGGTWTNWFMNGSAYNAVGEVPFNYGGCESLLLVANYATIGNVTIFDDNDYAIVGITSTSSGSGSAAIGGSAPAYSITASQKDDVTLTWEVTYPADVVYDRVTLVAESTNRQWTYNVGDISADKKFTLPISQWKKGVYNARISAWSSVKPGDPYTANIVLTITD